MFINKSLEVLKQKYPDLYVKVKSRQSEIQPSYQVIISKIGCPTLIVSNEKKSTYLHSRYNPIKEACQLIDEYYEENQSTYIIYGFGFAYHIEELLKRNPNIKIYVYETNINVFRLALENRDLGALLSNQNVQLFLEDELKLFASKFNMITKMSNYKLFIYMPSLNAIPKSLMQIRYLLEDFNMKKNTIEKFSGIMEYNFSENIKNYNYPISMLFNKFSNIPIFIIAAGPSLRNNIDLLQNVKSKGIIISVGTAVKPLLIAGIEPDLIIITDPQDIVMNQLEKISINVPIIVLSTANHNILKQYQGVKFLAFQKGYQLAEKYVSYDNYSLVNTGGSVATTALDISIKMGCNPIIFVGLDLAFTDNETHIKGTYFYKKVIDNQNLRLIKSQNNDFVYTSKNLYQYLKWIEKRINIDSKLKFINATEDGAFIDGTIQMKLDDAINKYSLQKSINFKQMILEIIEGEFSLQE